MRDRSSEPPKEQAPPKPASSVPPKPKLASPIDWWKLDASERAETLSVLAVWVPELVRRYELRDSVIAPCWYLHEPVVQELLALYQYRNQQQVLPSGPPSAMLDVHMQLQHALVRLRGWVQSAGCNLAEHRPAVQQSWVLPGTVAEAAWVVEVEEHCERFFTEVGNTDGDRHE